MRNRDKAHLERVRSLPCVVGMQKKEWAKECKGEVNAHHLIGGKYRGLSQKASDFETIPLCHEGHHQFGKNAIHDSMGQHPWEAKYGTQEFHLDITRECLKRVYPQWDPVTGERIKT